MSSKIYNQQSNKKCNDYENVKLVLEDFFEYIV